MVVGLRMQSTNHLLSSAFFRPFILTKSIKKNRLAQNNNSAGPMELRRQKSDEDEAGYDSQLSRLLYQMWLHDKAKGQRNGDVRKLVIEREDVDGNPDSDSEVNGLMGRRPQFPNQLDSEEEEWSDDWNEDGKKRWSARSKTVGILISLTTLTIVQTVVVSLTGSVIGGFYTSIASHDSAQFMQVAFLAFAVVALSALLDSTIKAVVESLAWQLRRALSSLLHCHYFRGTRYYAVLFSVDNADQRITQDVDNWATSLAGIISQVIAAPLIIVYYAVFTAAYISWYAPLIILVWFALGYLANRLLMAPIARVVVRQERFEGDFRHEHARVRADAESIAICQGGPVELVQSRQRFERVLANRLSLIKWHWGLNSTANVFSYVTTVLNYTVVALPILFLGSIDLPPAETSGYVAKASFYIIMLASGFSTFLNIASPLSDLFGYTVRIQQLLSALVSSTAAKDSTSKGSSINDSNSSDEEINSSSISSSSIAPPFATFSSSSSSPLLQDAVPTIPSDGTAPLTISDDRVEFQNVCYQIPGSNTLVRELSFLVEPGKNLLIMGPSGVGKSCLVRILSGIWQLKSGSITTPPRSAACLDSRGIYFLPQQPYFPIGSIAHQLTYPAAPSQTPIAREMITDLMRTVQLSHLLSRPEVWLDDFRSQNDDDGGGGSTPQDQLYPLVHWTDLLSPGEKQRLAFARVFFHQPAFAVLDEATSALPLEAEARLYQQCQTRRITLLSVAHRPSLIPFHSFLLRFSKHSNWSLQALHNGI